MIVHFPPTNIKESDSTFLAAEDMVFAKLKIETKAEKRTVFLTEHTLIFVLEGVKLLHFPEKTIKVEKGNIVLLKKGIYVMAEYIEEGLRFEALLVFLHPKVIKETLLGNMIASPARDLSLSFLIFPTNEHADHYKNQLRRYFDTPLLKDKNLLQLKQKEILTLLLKTIPSRQLTEFIATLAKNAPEDIAYIVEKHLLKALSIADYASLSNRSLTSFKRDFKKIFNASPRQWINQKRLEHAYLLLNNTSERISEVSDACGFESVSYFIKLFKQQYGCTPAVFRSKLATI